MVRERCCRSFLFFLEFGPFAWKIVFTGGATCMGERMCTKCFGASDGELTDVFCMSKLRRSFSQDRPS